MAPTKMACKNNEKYSYTGKEMSPLGLGFCADAENVGTAMMGRDGKNWLVGVKNGEKIWIRSPEKMVLAKEEPVLSNDTENTSEVVPVVEEKPKKEKKTPKTKTPTVSDSEEEKPAEEEKPKKEKKVSTRKAPTESATDLEEGTEKEGAEGVLYVVKADKNGTKKWMKKTEEKPKKEKATPSEGEEEKPKRKYNRKPKATDNDDAAPKKERKKRGPTAYNLFIGSKLKELRAKNPGKETTVYMREALDIWAGLTKEEKEAITAQAATEVDA